MDCCYGPNYNVEKHVTGAMESCPVHQGNEANDMEE